MSFWDRLRRTSTRSAAAAKKVSTTAPVGTKRVALPHESPAAEAASSPALTQLVSVDLPGGIGEEEALALFRGLRATPDEGQAVALLGERRRRSPLPPRLLLALASALSDRGETSLAIDTLEGETSSPALLLSADLHADRNSLPAALALVERVLSRDLDHPGARERHRRWLTALGLTRETTRGPREEENTVVARDPDAPFVLLREVARGGAGAVYEAEDRELGRHVALKVYHQPSRDREQLTHEARVATGLAGPGITRVFDADPDHGWIAIEWAEGGALKAAIRTVGIAGDAGARLLPLERWLVPLAETLARTHAAGWVHLDVKPANVLLDGRGRPLLADFGIARRAGEVSPPGSLGYVSPERLAGGAAAFTDDVFGFGRLLEDVLDAFDAAGAGAAQRTENGAANAAAVTRFRPLAAACTGPLAARPQSAAAIVTRLRVEHPGA